MKLTKKFDRAVILVIFAVFLLLTGCFFKIKANNTFAEEAAAAENGAFETLGAKYVTFYDDGEKLTVKTDAKTVQDALDRAGILVSAGDIVEPGLEAEINADNFYVNIYRARPVVVRDGITEKYLMTASYDARTIMGEAGITVYDGDEIKMVPNTNFLENGVANVYEITRNGGRTLTVEEEIPFTEEQVKDYNLAPGTSEVRQLGEVGAKKSYYNVLYVDNVEVSRELIGEEVVREPVARIVAVGTSAVEQHPLTASMGVNTYTVSVNGTTVLRRETYYDLDMSVVIRYCGTSYSVRADGVKVDQDGYVLVAANLGRYPRCSVVETSLGLGKVYDTGGFAVNNPEQFDIATDWTNRNGK